MSLAIGLIAIVVAVIAQVSILPFFSIFGVQPNLVIVLLVAWMAVRGQREVLLLVPAAGLVQGLLDSQPLGLAMLALAPIILMTEVREQRWVESDLVPALVLAALATLVYEATILLTLAVTGEHLDWLASVLDVLVPAAIANALLLLPVYGLIRLASQDLRQREAL
ncbi:MAG: rod shape-determining protein MreD [Chloroflexi bacterium RBG_16_68_14]|nr:MAG: rod shape-determining protein MreD [Chloroflexi bacterium RBG_16_68_14]